MTEMLRFWAFQRSFRIENRTIIKEFRAILLIFVSFGLPQTIGGAFIREGTTIRDNTVLSNLIMGESSMSNTRLVNTICASENLNSSSFWVKKPCCGLNRVPAWQGLCCCVSPGLDMTGHCVCSLRAAGLFFPIFEPTCAHAQWALMSRLPSVRPSVCLSVCLSVTRK